MQDWRGSAGRFCHLDRGGHPGSSRRKQADGKAASALLQGQLQIKDREREESLPLYPL